MAAIKDLIINNFQKGIGDSPYVGFGRMQNLEIFQTPGSAKIKYRNVLLASPVGMPIASCKATNGTVYYATDQGNIYDSVGNQYAANVGVIYDLKVWNNFLFYTYDKSVTSSPNYTGAIGIIGPLSGGTSFTNANYQTNLVSGYLYNKPLLPIAGDAMYIGNGANVGVLSNFLPSNPSGATWNPTAVPLPYGEYCRTLSQLGRSVLIGTQGGSGFTDLSQVIANIYPYDLGTLTLGFPIPFAENGINQMLAVNNQVYVHAGIYGNIYVTNGTSVKPYKKLPFNRAYGTTIFPYPNAMNYVNGELLIGTSTYLDSFPGSSSVHGIYSIYLATGALNFKTISTQNIGTNQQLKVGSILPTSQDQMFTGWTDGAVTGLDQVDSVVSNNFSAFFESQVFKVGTPLNNATFTDIEVQLSEPLITGQQINLKYRDGVTQPWTLIPGMPLTIANAQGGDATALYAKAKMTNLNILQVRGEAVQLDSTQFPGNVNFLEVRLRQNANG